MDGDHSTDLDELQKMDDVEASDELLGEGACEKILGVEEGKVVSRILAGDRLGQILSSDSQEHEGAEASDRIWTTGSYHAQAFGAVGTQRLPSLPVCHEEFEDRQWLSMIRNCITTNGMFRLFFF